ncbi:MAG: DUF6172 family protein [Verrucomicrobia bacterium]|nr:DUF6172 family protein [Verrucomicrobiota bacterium]
MKKTFSLTHPKISPARVADAVRSDVNKYLKRERRRELPEGFDFWDFDCKCGPTVDDARVVHVTEINKCIVAAEAQQLATIYVEILAKPARRTKKPSQAPTATS